MVDYNITKLDISCQGLTKLPDDIDKYTNLEILHCGKNKITSLDNLPPNLEILF
jgi:Leucine-rich repeat (LRR) protein